MLFNYQLSVCFGLVAVTSRRVPEYQNTWFQAVEARVNLTSHTLSSMQSVKLLGISQKMEATIQGKRKQEILMSQKFRFSNCLALTTCTTPPLTPGRQVLTSAAQSPAILSPFITFAAYSVVRLVSHDSSFSVTKAVTSLSILSLMNTPARRLLFAIPFGLQAVGSFDRIQNFLRLEQNPVFMTTSGSNDPGETQIREKTPERCSSRDLDSTSPFQGSRHGPAIHVKNAAFGWEAAAPPIISLHDICFARGSFTAITGPIGCGKSTLLKGLLSETACVQGIVQVSTEDIAYCGQTPWIHEGTIRDNIVGESKYDASWYKDVIRSCELDLDLSRMSVGDASMVGSRGLRLSGGQRQRIVRAILKFKPSVKCVL